MSLDDDASNRFLMVGGDSRALDDAARLLAEAGHAIYEAGSDEAARHLECHARLRKSRQVAIAELNREALRDASLPTLLNTVIVVVAETLEMGFGEILELSPDTMTVRALAEIGWREESRPYAHELPPHAQFALLAGRPVMMRDSRDERRFEITPRLRSHDIVCGISVLIPGSRGPWGMMSLFSTQACRLSLDDAHFLESVAYIIAGAMQRSHVIKVSREREKLLNIAGRMARLGGWLVDLAENRVLWSDEVCAIHEVPVGTSPTLDEGIEFYAPEWRDRIKTVIDACIRDGTPYAEELQIVTARGRRVWVLANGEAVRDAQGHTHQLIGAIRDITHKKRAEQRVQSLAARLEATLESITDAFFTVDRQWRFTYLNKEAERVLLRPRESLIDQVCWECFEEIRDTQCEREYRRAMRDNRSVCFEAFHAPLDRWFEVSAYPYEEGLTVYLRDITDRKAYQEELKFLAWNDPLTRLPNRRFLLDRIEKAFIACERSGQHGAMLYVDLDNFKVLNDTLGHNEGDRLLQEVASRLVDCVGESDTVSRFGGDEFLIVLEGLSPRGREAAMQAGAVSERMLAALSRPYLLGGRYRNSTPSIGVTLFGVGENSVEELIKRADFALYQAKACGRNTVRFFDPEMQSVVSARMALEAAIAEGLRREEFVAYLQPKMDMRGELAGAEALVRWHHPERGLLLPNEFIPLAEEAGHIAELGIFMLETVCTRLAAWASLPGEPRLGVSVNVSVHQFQHPDFVAQVLEIVERTGVDPHRLTLELTETLLLEDLEETAAKMHALKARGIRFSLDDFGTGYSSLYYLKRLPLDELKIDKSFVGGVLSNANDAAIVNAIISLAASLGLDAVAEGVETEQIWHALMSQGCAGYQGHYFSRPLSLDEFEAFVSKAVEAK